MDEKYLFVVAQKAIIKIDDKFLLLKRSPQAKVFPRHWDFPGGKLEHGENFKEALAREVKEETSLDVIVEEMEFIYVENEVHPSYVVLFECEKELGEVKISKEHTEFKWINKTEALKLKIEPYLKAYLESLD
jgi:8-oxo-dGTP diphosphatase